MNGFEKRKEKKKISILEAALNMFMADGIQNTSVSDIAKRAKVSQVTIYNYFESKQNLLKAVMIYYFEKVQREFVQIIDSEIPFAEKIKLIILEEKLYASELNEELYTCIMNEYVEEPEYLAEFTRKGLLVYEKLFNQGREEGMIDPSISNKAILAYINMLAVSMRNKEVYNGILPLTEEIMKILMYGICGEAGRRNA